MQSSNALYKDGESGFTLLEIIIVIAIIAILGAIVTPSFTNLYNVNRVNDAIGKAKGAIQEAQNQAIRYGRKCEIKIVNVNEPTNSGTLAIHPTIEAVPFTSPRSGSAPKDEACLLNGDRILYGIKLSGSTIPDKISFDSKGRTDVSSAGTMIFSIPDAPQPQKCIVISPGLGLIRSGNYLETPSAKCETSR